MNVGSIMTTNVITVDMDTQLTAICSIFDQNNIHHLPVIDNDEVLGVISDRDVLKAISPFLDTLAEQKRDLATLKKRAHQVMSRKPFSISKEASLEEASSMLIHNNISCLLIISVDGQIEGILTWKDLLKAYSLLVKVD